MKTLHSDTLDTLNKRGDIIRSARRAMEGKVAYVIMNAREHTEKKSSMRIFTVSVRFCVTVMILNLDLRCMKKTKMYGDVLSVQTENG